MMKSLAIDIAVPKPSLLAFRPLIRPAVVIVRSSRSRPLPSSIQCWRPLLQQHECRNLRSTSLLRARAAPHHIDSGVSREISNPPQQESYKSNTSQHESPIHQSLHRPFLLHMILEIIAFLWRLPTTISGVLRREKKLIDTIEEDIEEGADIVKIGAKVVEEVAEGLEKVAKVVDNDAKKVDALMDEVKTTAKATHDELEDAIGMLDGSIQDVQKVKEEIKEAKSKIDKVKAKDAINTIEEQEESMTRTNSSSMSIPHTTWSILLFPRMIYVVEILASHIIDLFSPNIFKPWLLKMGLVCLSVLALFYHHDLLAMPIIPHIL